MRPLVHVPLLALALVACEAKPGGATTDTDADTDVVVADAACTEAYSVPGAFGTTSTEGIDAHQDVFGGTETLGEGVTIGPDPVHVHLGWPGQDSSRSISFVWQTDTGTLASRVELAEGSDLTDAIAHDGVSYKFAADAYRVHELKLCGRLKPSTTYSYRVGGEGHWSQTYTFSTPAAPGSTDTFTMLLMGDSRGSYEDFANLVQRAAAESPDLFVFTGDMVAIGPDQLQWHGWWEATGDVFAETVIVPAIGNHEALAANYFAQFSLPNNEQWFAVDYGNATIVSLNSGLESTPGDIAGAEADFLDATLGASTAQWKLAMHHETMVTVSNHDPNADAYAAWGPILDEHGADLVLAGHNHLYERSKPISAGEPVAPGEGTVFMVSGGAGAPLYDGATDDEERLAKNEVAKFVNHYVVLTFSPDGVHGVTKDLAGSTIDEFDVVDRH